MASRQMCSGPGPSLLSSTRQGKVRKSCSCRQRWGSLSSSHHSFPAASPRDGQSCSLIQDFPSLDHGVAPWGKQKLPEQMVSVMAYCGNSAFFLPSSILMRMKWFLEALSFFFLYFCYFENMCNYTKLSKLGPLLMSMSPPEPSPLLSLPSTNI